MDKTTVFIGIPKTRKRVRRVDEIRLADCVRTDGNAGWRIRAVHGGSVANCYGYAAGTETAVAVRDPVGRVIVWMGDAPANKVTLCGTAGAALTAARDLFDHRVKNAERKRSAWDAVKKVFIETWVAETGTPADLAAIVKLGGDLDTCDIGGADPAQILKGA